MKKLPILLLLFVGCFAPGCRHKTEVNTYHIRSKDDGPLWCGYQKGLAKEDSVFFNRIVSIYMGVPGYGEKCLDNYPDSIQYRLMYEGGDGFYIVRINPHDVLVKVNGDRYNEKGYDIRKLTPQEQKEFRAYQYINYYEDSTSKIIKDSIRYYQAAYPKILNREYYYFLKEKRYGFVNDTVFYKLITIPISTAEFGSIDQKIIASGFWNTKSYNDHAIEVDGSWWALEVKKGPQYHYVYYDDIYLNRKFRNLCMEFLKYTNADTSKIN